MSDLERRLRDTYAAALDTVEAPSRLAEIPIPARRQAQRIRGWRPALAFGAAALGTLLVIGGIAYFTRGLGEPEPVATVTANETPYESGAGTITEIRFPDATIIAVGGVGGRPAVVALTEDRLPVLRIMVATGEWEEHPVDPWSPDEGVTAFGSDGEALAIVLTDGQGSFTTRITTDGESWSTSTVATAGSTLEFGSPAARLTSFVRDVSVDGARVTLLIDSTPTPEVAELEDALRRTGALPAGVDIDQVTEWGPDGIGLRLSDGSEARYTLGDLGIDPAWALGAWEVHVVQGASSAFPIDAAGLAFTPLTATSAGDGLFVGGVDRDGARLLTWDGESATFVDVDLVERIGPSSTPLLAVTALRTTDGVAVAGISTQGAAVAARLDGTARAGWALEGATDLAVAEMAARDGRVATIGYPGVVVSELELASTAVVTTSVADDFGIADRHPTHITLTEAGVISLPQAGSDPSSFGSDGSAWLIDLDSSAPARGD